MDIGQGVPPCGAKKLEILAIFRIFWLETPPPKYLRISVKFGTADGTCGPLSRAKFHANQWIVSPLRGEKKTLKIAC